MVDLHAGTNDAELRARSWGRASLTPFVVLEFWVSSPPLTLVKERAESWVSTILLRSSKA